MSTHIVSIFSSYRFIAKVVAIDKEEGGKVKVHFAGWGSRFDEWVEISDQRLREAGPNAAERFHRKKEKPVSYFIVHVKYFNFTCISLCSCTCTWIPYVHVDSLHVIVHFKEPLSQLFHSICITPVEGWGQGPDQMGG